MQSIMEKEIILGPSLCDRKAKLDICATFSIFMDIATEHAENLGIGPYAMLDKGLFWLTVRTKIKFIKRPQMMDKVIIKTWPEKPEKIRCNRDYQIKMNGETFVLGRTEWAVLDTSSGRLKPGQEVFPQEINDYRSSVFTEQFTRFSFEDGELISEYDVKSCDIDLGGHMNNAIYPKVILNSVSYNVLPAEKISDFEIHFKNQCFEGEHLQIKYLRDLNHYYFGIYKEDGRAAALAIITAQENF